MARDMPAAEVDLQPALVRALLADQHPDLAGLSLVELTSGWDNVIYRLGSKLLVRLPRRAVAAELVANEQRWLPTLAPGLPLPIPTPVRIGRPGLGFPWAWSVCPWFDGSVAAEAPPSDVVEAAGQLGEFLAALRQPAPPDAPTNPFRGIPLFERAERLQQGVAVLGSLGMVGVGAVVTNRVLDKDCGPAGPVPPPVAGLWRRVAPAEVEFIASVV